MTKAQPWETPDKGDGWQPISQHNGDSELYDLAWYYEPSAFAAINGSMPFWAYAEGRKIYEGCWAGILGGQPSHFRPHTGSFEE